MLVQLLSHGCACLQMDLEQHCHGGGQPGWQLDRRWRGQRNLASNAGKERRYTPHENQPLYCHNYKLVFSSKSEDYY